MGRALFMALLFLCKFCFSQYEKDSSFKRHILDFENFIKKVEENFVDDIEVERLILSAKKQTIQSLDPYSKYYTKEESQERNKTWKGISYAGIGATLIQTNMGVMIYSIRKGYGAEKKGLQPGDIIYKIHDSICLNLKLNNVIKLLKGPPNTEVEITVKRDELYKFEKIIRQNIISPSISFSDTIGNNIGLIKIDQFLRGSGQLFRDKLELLISKGATKIVIDLRGNRGGLVNETVMALSAILKKGTIIYELKSNDLKSNYIDSTNLEPISTTIPLVLLVDNKTISSGEIFSGALQDLDRAVLIGQNTFGKGLVQGTRFFEDGSSIYITAARYHLPSGRCIQKKNYNKNYNLGLPSNLTNNKIFFSLNKRPLKNANGVSPEIKLGHKSEELMIFQVIEKTTLPFDFAIKCYKNHYNDYSKNWRDIQIKWKHYLIENKDKILLEQDSHLSALELKKNSRKWLKSLEKTNQLWQKEKVKQIENTYLETSILVKEKLILFNEFKQGLYLFKSQLDPWVLKAIEIFNSNQYDKILNPQ